jgi:hypothetical protein
MHGDRKLTSPASAATADGDAQRPAARDPGERLPITAILRGELGHDRLEVGAHTAAKTTARSGPAGR